MADELPSTEHHRRALDRVIFLSDGVFAIAMTLLVLDLRLPPMAVRSSAALRDALLADIPRFISFFISFEVIGIFWLAHLRQFSLIARYTRGLAFINLLFLMSIAIMPFSTTLVGEYGSLSLAAVFYSLSLVFTSVASNLLWLYAAGGRRLIDPHASREDMAIVTTRGIVTLAFFIIGTGLAFVSVGLASAAWISIPIATRIAERIARRRSSRGRRVGPSSPPDK